MPQLLFVTLLVFMGPPGLLLYWLVCFISARADDRDMRRRARAHAPARFVGFTAKAVLGIAALVVMDIIIFYGLYRVITF